jgi:hypothetical protein
MGRNNLTLVHLLPVNRSAERSQRIQISRRVVTDQIDRPCAKQHEGRRNGDDGAVRIMAVLPLFWKSQRHNLYWLALISTDIADAYAD